ALHVGRLAQDPLALGVVAQGAGREHRRPADVQGAFAELGSVPCILEGFVPFTGEVSLVAVRARDGETRFYPLVHNTHD
ncbi:ATP-grasp domain-containing protein, partial [Pseudomonas aeruginosa]